MVSNSKTVGGEKLRKAILHQLRTQPNSVLGLSYELDKSPHQIGMVLKHLVKEGLVFKTTYPPPRHSEYRIP